MKRYIVVTAKAEQEFLDLVNRRIAEGYEPIGGVQVFHYPRLDIPEYYQSMWKPYESGTQRSGR